MKMQAAAARCVTGGNVVRTVLRELGALDTQGSVHPYFRGEWGPAQADRILDGDTWFVPSS